MNGWEFLALVLVAIMALSAGYYIGRESVWSYLGKRQNAEKEQLIEQERQEKIQDMSGG